MPTCKACDKGFPCRMIIDGKERILSKRKYCLECSPFNSHNTTNPLLRGAWKDRVCPICDRHFSNRHQRLCHACHSKLRRMRTKQKAVEYKGGKCNRCG